MRASGPLKGSRMATRTLAPSARTAGGISDGAAGTVESGPWEASDGGAAGADGAGVASFGPLPDSPNILLSMPRDPPQPANSGTVRTHIRAIAAHAERF